MSVPSFADLGVSAPVASALAGRGIDSPFAIQTLVLPDALAGRDVLAKSPTGTGKTLGFLLPIIERLNSRAPAQSGLVLAPSRELASQIAAEATPLAAARGLRVASVYGGVGIERQAKLARTAHLLVATPGRLLDLMSRGDVSLSKVEILVLDEADRMLDMGFRKTVDRIVRATPSKRQTLFFSATLSGEVGELANLYTKDACRHEHQPAQRRQERIDHQFVSVVHDQKLERLVDELDSKRERTTLVFVRTRRGADRLVKRMHSRGFEAAALHGDKSQGQRERALAQFANGSLKTLVATDVAARGIDVSGITHVINFDIPADSDTYVHRTGRTGRAESSGTAITFVAEDETREVGRMVAGLGLRDSFARSGFAVETAKPARGGGGGGNRARRSRSRPAARPAA